MLTLSQDEIQAITLSLRVAAVATAASLPFGELIGMALAEGLAILAFFVVSK